MISIDKLIVRPHERILAALQRLDETALGILLLVDDGGRLARTITDGDLRRMLLSGASLNDALNSLPPQPPKVVDLRVADGDILRQMNSLVIDHIPVVDEEGRPIGLKLRRDIDAKILLSTPHLGEHEMSYVEEAFRSNWIAPLGPNVDAFERELAEYVGVRHAAAVCSGTAAIHLGLHVLGVGPGDVVFCSTLTFVASANPILYLGATPVFIDSEPNTWNMSPQALRRALKDFEVKGKLPKAVVVVNLYGQSADMQSIMGICQEFDVPVVEDAAESLGASYRGRASGTLGRVGVYSFNGNKIITTSGGGMLVSDDGHLIALARSLSTQAREHAPWYEHTQVGYNYRMSNILAGVGRGQLQVLEQRVLARRAIFERYSSQLAMIDAIRWMPEAKFGRSTRWLSVCTIDESKSDLTPGAIISILAKDGIEARHVWKPMHRQPLYEKCAYYPHDEGSSFSDWAFASGICLPSGSNLSQEQQERIIRSIRRAFERKVVE